MRTDVYAFSISLCVHLLGMALGSLVCAGFVSRVKGQLRAFIVMCQDSVESAPGVLHSHRSLGIILTIVKRFTS